MKLLAWLPLFAVALGAQAPSPAGRWEVALWTAKQSYASGDEYARIGPTVVHETYNNAKNTVFGLRLGFDVVNTGRWSLQANGSYQPDSSTDLRLDDTTFGTTTSYWSHYHHRAVGLGLMPRFHGIVTLGLGLELKAEHVSIDPTLDASGGNRLSGSGALTRMWWRAAVGVPFSLGPLQSSLGVEWGRPMDGNSHPLTLDDNGDAKASYLGPTGQVGLSFSVRF